MVKTRTSITAAFLIISLIIIVNGVIVNKIASDSLQGVIANNGKTTPEELTAVQATLQYAITIGVVVVLLFSVLLGIVISYSITRPLSKLTNVVDQISRGNFKVKTETSRIDEINILTQSLDRVMKTMKLAVMETKKVKVRAKKMR